MDQDSFTKGPWRIWEKGGVVSDHPALEIRGSEDTKTYGGHLICESVSKANARLIAIAPEMFELIKEHLRKSGCDGDLCSRVWHEDFRKLINRVEEE